MRAGFAAATIGALAWFSGFSGAQASDATIPDVFHGVWEGTTLGKAPGCAADSDTRIEIGSRRIDYHESVCTVQGVVPGTGNPLQLQTYCEGEGFEWVNVEEWSLQQSGGQSHLVVRSLDPGNAYEAVYGACAGQVVDEAGADMEEAEPARTYCYREDMSELKVTTLGGGRAVFEVESAQGGAHICGLAGEAESSGNGYLYTEQIEGVGLCRLSIVFGDDDSVSFRDPDWTCKQYYCGARAAFEHIEFGPSARVACD